MENSIFRFPMPYENKKKKFKSVFNAIGKRNTKMEARIPCSNVVGKQKTKNGNGNWNSVFQSGRKTENENGTMNFVSQCCSKTENNNESCILFFDAKEKRLALKRLGKHLSCYNKLLTLCKLAQNDKFECF